MEKEDKKTFSVDRVESRRQRRIYNLSKGSMPSNIQKVKNHSKRSMSEGRHDKKILMRSRSQRQMTSLQPKNDHFATYGKSPKLKEINSSRDSVAHLKNSSLKSVHTNLKFLDNPSIRQNLQNPFEGNSSLASVRMQSIDKGSEDASFFTGNEIMTRKFSHINKLAQGLALNNIDDIPFQLAKERAPLRPNASHKLKSLKLKRNNSNVNFPITVKKRGLIKSKSELSQDFMVKVHFYTNLEVPHFWDDKDKNFRWSQGKAEYQQKSEKF